MAVLTFWGRELVCSLTANSSFHRKVRVFRRLPARGQLCASVGTVKRATPYLAARNDCWFDLSCRLERLRLSLG
jgi:hypothetical protein